MGLVGAVLFLVAYQTITPSSSEPQPTISAIDSIAEPSSFNPFISQSALPNLLPTSAQTLSLGRASEPVFSTATELKTNRHVLPPISSNAVFPETSRNIVAGQDISQNVQLRNLNPPTLSSVQRSSIANSNVLQSTPQYGLPNVLSTSGQNIPSVVVSNNQATQTISGSNVPSIRLQGLPYSETQNIQESVPALQTIAQRNRIGLDGQNINGNVSPVGSRVANLGQSVTSQPTTLNVPPFFNPYSKIDQRFPPAISERPIQSTNLQGTTQETVLRSQSQIPNQPIQQFQNIVRPQINQANAEQPIQSYGNIQSQNVIVNQAQQLQKIQPQLQISNQASIEQQIQNNFNKQLENNLNQQLQNNILNQHVVRNQPQNVNSLPQISNQVTIEKKIQNSNQQTQNLISTQASQQQIQNVLNPKPQIQAVPQTSIGQEILLNQQSPNMILSQAAKPSQNFQQQLQVQNQAFLQQQIENNYNQPPQNLISNQVVSQRVQNSQPQIQVSNQASIQQVQNNLNEQAEKAALDQAISQQQYQNSQLQLQIANQASIQQVQNNLNDQAEIAVPNQAISQQQYQNSQPQIQIANQESIQQYQNNFNRQAQNAILNQHQYANTLNIQPQVQISNQASVDEEIRTNFITQPQVVQSASVEQKTQNIYQQQPQIISNQEQLFQNNLNSQSLLVSNQLQNVNQQPQIVISSPSVSEQIVQTNLQTQSVEQISTNQNLNQQPLQSRSYNYGEPQNVLGAQYSQSQLASSIRPESQVSSQSVQINQNQQSTNSAQQLFAGQTNTQQSLVSQNLVIPSATSLPPVQVGQSNIQISQVKEAVTSQPITTPNPYASPQSLFSYGPQSIEVSALPSSSFGQSNQLSTSQGIASAPNSFQTSISSSSYANPFAYAFPQQNYLQTPIETTTAVQRPTYSIVPINNIPIGTSSEGTVSLGTAGQAIPINLPSLSYLNSPWSNFYNQPQVSDLSLTQAPVLPSVSTQNVYAPVQSSVIQESIDLSSSYPTNPFASYYSPSNSYSSNQAQIFNAAPQLTLSELAPLNLPQSLSNDYVAFSLPSNTVSANSISVESSPILTNQISSKISSFVPTLAQTPLATSLSSYSPSTLSSAELITIPSVTPFEQSSLYSYGVRPTSIASKPCATQSYSPSYSSTVLPIPKLNTPAYLPEIYLNNKKRTDGFGDLLSLLILSDVLNGNTCDALRLETLLPLLLL